MGPPSPSMTGRETSERLLPVDWVPRIIAADEWQTLSAGLLQRGKAINAWLRGVYGAGQDLVPEEIVRGSVFYRPHDLPGSSPPIHVYGPDVVHLASGEYVVLEDNVRVPSGVAYSEAIRRAGMETMPEVYEAYRAMEIYSYYDRLGETLELAAPRGGRRPERGRDHARGRRPRVLRAPQDRPGVRHSADDARRLRGIRRVRLRARERQEDRRDLPPLRRGLHRHGPSRAG